MTTDCSLNYKFKTWKFKAQTWGEHVVYRNCFWHSEQFLNTTCSPYALQKEELLTKIYLYVCSKSPNISKVIHLSSIVVDWHETTTHQKETMLIIVLQTACLYLLKVRQIRKGFFKATIPPKMNKRIMFFCLTNSCSPCLTLLWTNLFVHFLEDFEDTKKSFRN